ncbi:unnamed protein product [Soboliphyme baturini]|uniref:E3 ubiquitin-protein ligase TRIM71 n=1 Tax=Soboliphyme baturini TaxID=241478 RepID=A0A183IPL9_9BILA|nr:unnamed protein product [Soboliphyme baturini]
MSVLLPPPPPKVDYSKKQATNSRIYGDVLHYIKNAECANEMVEHMLEKVEARLSSVSAEIRSVAHHLVAAVEERRDALLQQVETVRGRKGQVLNAQRDKLHQYLSKLNAILSSLEFWSPDSPEYETKARTILKEQCGNINGLQPLLSPQEDDKVVFIPPDANLCTILASFGFILSGAYAPNSVIVGEVSRHATKDKNICLTVQAKSHIGEQCTTGGDHVTAVAYVPNGMTIPVKIMDKQNGRYLCSYTPSVEGEHKVNQGVVELVHIFIRGLPIHDSPFVVNVKCGRDYCGIKAQPIFSFGGEGTANGLLCRPWGITCDRLGRIIIADRSNNRVQIFDKDGKFLTKFGSLGCRSGQFDRPAGVAVNSHNNIIVVDKDNHRIQVRLSQMALVSVLSGHGQCPAMTNICGLCYVFTENGDFLFKFGEKGREPGRFNYPWDVAVSSEDVMAVSDTRNHRVQVFNAYGVFLKKIGFESSLFYKQFDSPRGVAFSSDGRLFCTDFNNHRLVIAELKSDKLKFFGREGDGDGCFKRPQGIEIDAQGNVVVADSRNNRIQVFSSQLNFMCSFGVHNINAHPRSVMDRPCDVCVTADGRIFVVDFGNNKIHVF